MAGAEKRRLQTDTPFPPLATDAEFGNFFFREVKNISCPGYADNGSTRGPPPTMPSGAELTVCRAPVKISASLWQFSPKLPAGGARPESAVRLPGIRYMKKSIGKEWNNNRKFPKMTVFFSEVSWCLAIGHGTGAIRVSQTAHGIPGYLPSKAGTLFSRTPFRPPAAADPV